MKKIDYKKQLKTPYLEAYKKYLEEKQAVFDVPGHHQGNIETDFNKVFGDSIYKSDVNAPRGMDNLSHPKTVIKEAQDLFAEATNASYSKFLVNGSSEGNLIMLMSTLSEGDKILLPRNVHKSVISALILCGATPIFLMPEIDEQTEIVNQISYKEWKKAIDFHSDAKAIFIINPTYFGATTNLKKIVDYAHLHHMVVLVDEAHGTHFYFSNSLPISAMDAGADMTTLSVHKTGGSLTQSSVLLVKGERVLRYDVVKTFNLLTTTSPSSLLIASLDSARKFLVFEGKKYINEAIRLAKICRDEINKIPGFIARDKEYFKTKGAYSYDDTKVVVEIDKLSITGFEVYKILRDRFHIQIELAETYVFLLLFTVGSKEKDITILCNALRKISDKYYDPNVTYENHRYMSHFPELVLTPREAYQAPLKVVKLQNALNKIAKETIMIYPPGIPLIVPGERFTQEVIDELAYYRKIKANIVSDYEGPNAVSVIDERKLKEEELEKFLNNSKMKMMAKSFHQYIVDKKK